MSNIASREKADCGYLGTGYRRRYLALGEEKQAYEKQANCVVKNPVTCAFHVV